MSGPPTLTHRIEGEGEVVLFLNGGMMTFASWGPVSSLFVPEYRVLGCDLRGQLLSPGVSHTRLEGHVEDVVALLDELGLSRVHVVGASFGAEIGLLTAALHPDRVTSLIAVTATDYADDLLRDGVDRLREACRDALQGGDGGRIHDILVPEVFSESYIESQREVLDARRSQVAALPEVWFIGLQGILDCTASFDLRPHLGAIRCPTLVVTAEQDRVMPPARSRSLVAAVPGARLVRVDGSGHALVAERPDELARICLSFLREVGS